MAYKGRNWTYIRGKNLKSKLQQLYCPENYNTLRANIDYALKQLEQYKGISLLEDHVTCLSEDPKGNIWIGYRTEGYEIYNPPEDRILCSKSDKKHIFDIVASGVNKPVFGCFGEGLQEVEWPDETYSLELLTEKNTQEEFISLFHMELPSVAALPSAESLKKITEKIESLPELEGQQAVYLGEDWTTQGDWVGRYGREYTVLCAADSPRNHWVGWHDLGYDIKGEVGLHGAEDEGLRHWIHWMKTDDKRVLYNPLVGYRREAEWDDHGEVYSWNFDGPDIWIAVRVPDGMQKVTLYFINPNGHNPTEQNRDYIVEVKDYADDLAKAHFSPTLAKTRVRDFWGGVYKSFLVNGSNCYLIHIKRNYSFNTLIAAVMIDQLKESSPRIVRQYLPMMCDIFYAPPQWTCAGAGSEALLITESLWRSLNDAYDKENNYKIQKQGRLYAYRIALAEKAQENLLDNWRWELCLWNENERWIFARRMERAWEKLLVDNPAFSKKL